MSAKEQYAAINGDDTDDEKITIKFTTASIDDKDCCTSSNDDDDTDRKKPNRQRKLSDATARKRSASNIVYKMSRAMSDTHGGSGGSGRRGLSPSRAANAGGDLRKQLLVRRSPSPAFLDRCTSPNGTMLSPGYVQYQMSLLEVPMPRDYGEASSDDLSSEWDSDVQEPQRSPKVVNFFLLLILLSTNFIQSFFFSSMKLLVSIFI